MNLYDQSISVTRPTWAKDAAGFPKQTFAAHLSGVACRVQPISGSENVRAGRAASQRTYRVYVPNPSVDIATDDRITLTVGATTRTLQVIEPMIDFDMQGRVGRLVAEEVNP
jgi:head-tail adaptor